MRRQTIFNTNVVYVRKGSRFFPEGRSQPPPVERKPDIREMLKKIAETDKEIGRLILKIRMELESPKIKKPRTDSIQTPSQVMLPSIILASASTGEKDE